MAASVRDEQTWKMFDDMKVAEVISNKAAKSTETLITLWHPVLLCHVAVTMEMEAMTSLFVSALTVYDMCKAERKSIVIWYVRL